MPPLAVGLSRMHRRCPNAAKGVLSDCYSLHVVGIHAGSVAAQMVNYEAIGYRAAGQLKGDAMNDHGPAATGNDERAIAMPVDVAGPDVAARDGVWLGPCRNPFGDRYAREGNANAGAHSRHLITTHAQPLHQDDGAFSGCENFRRLFGG